MKSAKITLTVFLLIFTALIVGCSHEHEYLQEVTTEVTCAENGSLTYICGCGEFYTEEIKAEGHKWNNGEMTVIQNCGTDGLKIMICSVCAETKEETFPATGAHSWNKGEIKEEQTCSKDGVKIFTCTVCAAENSESLPATGEHLWNEGEITKESTCAEEGTKTYTCIVCSTTQAEELPLSDTHSWNEGTETKASTCIEKGSVTYSCTVCKTEKTESLPISESHSWDKGTITKKPTCSSKGKIKYTCTLCTETSTKTLSKSDEHDWQFRSIEEGATMKKNGMEWYACKNCDNWKDIMSDKLPYREDMYDYGQIEYSDFMWYLSKSGELRITGTGAMPTFKIFREYENVGIYPSPSGKYDGKYVPTGKPTRDVNTVPWKDYLDKIKTVVVEEGCTEIGSYAFCNCVNLEKVTLPKSVERLGNDRTSHSYRSFVFVNCQKLKEVIAPGVQYAATYTFSNCPALEYVELPSIKTLIYDTFYNCPSIKKIVLGKNLTNVCLGAAENCQIDAVYFYGDAPEITDVWGAPKKTPVFSTATVVYYAQGTSGWTSNWGDCNVKPFNP